MKARLLILVGLFVSMLTGCDAAVPVATPIPLATATPTSRLPTPTLSAASMLEVETTVVHHLLEYIDYNVVVTNNGSKEIKSLSGVMVFSDRKLDRELYRLQFDSVKPLLPDEFIVEVGSILYSEDDPNLKRLSELSAKEVKLTFEPKELVFADGTTEKYP
jgi:hypothetical protein